MKCLPESQTMLIIPSKSMYNEYINNNVTTLIAFVITLSFHMREREKEKEKERNRQADRQTERQTERYIYLEKI